MESTGSRDHHTEPLLIVSPSATFRGGADGSLLHLLRRFRQFPQPLIVVFLESGPLVEEARSLGLPFHLIEAGRLREFKRLLFSVTRLSQLITDLRPSVVLSWQAKAHIYASAAATLARTSAKLVYFQKNTPDRSWLSRLIRVLPATGALACSEYVATRERALTRFPVLAVPSASEFVELSQSAIESLRAEGKKLRVTLPLPEGCKIAIMVGRLQSWKGFHAFVQAIATLRQEGLNIAGIIVGGSDAHESNYEPVLRDFIESLGLTRHIYLAGSQSSVATWFLAADLFVHASREEPFGQVILEAMALGVPVIACRPGGPEEIVTHGQDGLLYKHGRQNELVNFMRQLALDSELCLRYGQQAQASARRFAPRIFLTRLHAALAELPGASPDA